MQSSWAHYPKMWFIYLTSIFKSHSYYFLPNILRWISCQLLYSSVMFLICHFIYGSTQFTRIMLEICCKVCSGFPVNFSESVGKLCLITMVTAPPPKRPLKRGLVYHLCSRLNNMSVNGIRTAPAHLLLVWQIAPILPPPLLFQHPPPWCPPPLWAPLWIMNDFPTVCHASYFSSVNIVCFDDTERFHLALHHFYVSP